MNKLHSLRAEAWKVPIALGLIGLTRPLFRIGGDIFGYTVTTPVIGLLSICIGVVWIMVALKQKDANPIFLLAKSGAVYGVISILLAVVIQICIPGLKNEDVNIPILLSVGLAGATFVNIIYGSFLGIIVILIKTTRN